MEYTNLSEEENTQKQPQQMQSIAQPATTQPQQTITQPATTQPQQVQQPTKKMSLTDQINQYSIEKENQKKANLDKYGIELDQIEYESLATELDKAETAEEADAVKYRYAAAKQYSKTFGVSMENAFEHLDEYGQALYAKSPKLKEYDQIKNTKSWYEAISDSFTIGENCVKMADLGYQLKLAEKKGDTELINSIMKLYDALEADNNNRVDTVPRNIFVGAGKFAANMIPFTGRAMAYSLIPKGGPVLGFLFSATQAEGRTYMELRRDGCSIELADKISVIDGDIEGVIEMALGLVKGGQGAVSKLTGKPISKSLNERIVNKIVSDFRGGAVYKVMADTGMRLIGQGIDEGIEEVLQDGTNLMARYIASRAEDYDLDMTAGDVAQTLMESFAGGFAGSLLLGAPATAIHVGTDVKDIRDLKAAAEAIPSKETFVAVVKNAEAQREKEGKNKIFAEMDESTKDEVISNIWENVNKEKTKKNEKTAKELAEVYGAEDNMEVFADFDENGNEIEAQEIPAEYRTEEGRLYSTNTSTGENKGQFKIGDGSQENGKVYGYINYSIDEDSNTVTIENFKTTVERGNLRNEMFMEFAKDMSGYEIKWDPKGKFAKEIKENLVSLNPYGKKAGLSYFKIGENVSKQEQEDSYTRSKILSQIAQNMDVKAEERAPMLAVFEQIAKHNGMSVSDMFYGVFDGNVFGKISQNKTMKQADNAGAIRGGISIENVMGSIKATIYAAENADFSTWNHELAHLYRSMMQGDELAEAEKAFGVKDGNWTRQNEEDFAVGLEEYLRTGKVKSGALNEMFQKVVEFMARVYNGLKEGGLIKLSKEMEEFFDGIIESDNEVWAKAQEAVKNADANRSVEADVKSEQKAEAVKENKEIQPKKNVDETIAEGMNAKKKAAAVTDTKTDTDVKAEDKMQLSEENKEKLNTVKEDPQLSVEEKMAEGETIAAQQLQEDRAESLRDGGNVLSDDDIMDLFQLVGPNGRSRLAGELAREADEAAFKLAEEGKSNEEILAKTGRVFKDGRLWYDTKDGDFFDSVYLGNSINKLNKLMEEAYFAGGKIQDADFETAKANALKLKNAAEGIEKQLTDLNLKYGTIGKLYNASAVYKAAPYLRNKKVEFECNAKDFHVSRIYDDKVIFNFFGVKDMANVMNELKNVLDEYIKADESGKAIPDNGINHLFLKEQIKNPINKKIIQSIAGVNVVNNQSKDLFQKVTEKDLKERIDSIKHTEQRSDYIKRYYTDIKEQYEEKEVSSQDGRRTGRIEIAKDKDLNDRRTKIEIDAALKFKSMGYEPTLLSESSSIDNGPKIDMLLDHNILVEIKTPTGNANGIAKEIQAAIQKGNSEIVSVFLIDNASITDDEISKYLSLKKKYITEKTDGIFIFRNEDISEIKIPRVESLQTRAPGNSNILQEADIVKQNEKKSSTLFQAVFHGSPHIIRRPGGDVLRGEELGFDHSKMGSGEGAQAFGWGTYVTQVEGIAKNYASKLAGTPYTEEETERLARINEIHSAPSRLLISIDSKKDFLKSRRANLRDLDNGKYEARINKNIKEFTKELKAAQKQKNEDDIKFYEDLINTSIEDLDPKHKEDLRGKFQEDIDKTLVEIEDLKKQQKTAAKLLEKELPALQKEMEEIQSAAKERPAENVYTLDIPDEDKGNYIPWNEPLSVEQFRAIFKQAKAENLERFVGYLIEDVVMNDDTFTPPTGEWLYKNDLKWDISSDKEKSLFLNRAGITGISYPAQYLSGGREDGAKNYVIFNENDIKVTDWHAKNSEGVDLFQTAYHGSGADFEKFDTENFGFSGEGSMSFGYGTYVTDNEEIARDYADRQVSQKYQNVDDPYNVLKTNIIATIIHDTEVKGFEKALKERIEFLQKRIENSQGFYTEEQVENSKKVLDEIKNYTEEDLKKRHLYTVEIPDDGYIVWDKPVRKQTADKIKRALFNEITTNPDSAYYNYYSKSDLMQELDSVFSYMEGQQLYRNVSAYLEGDEKASKFLRKIGYAGLKYPAGTIHGNGRDAYNYVIFNDDDAKITSHEYFQTQAKLMEDAANEDSWENLRDYYSWALEDDENNVVPTDADNSYFMNIWEIAHNVSPTTAEREQMEIEARKKQDEYEAEVERRDPVTLDSIFMAELKAGKGRLETFLAAINEALSIDAEQWRAEATEAEAAEADALIELQHRIRGELKHGTWISNVQRVAGGKGLTEETKKRMLTLIRNNVRQYRALYADIMNEPKFAVKKAENTDVVELAEAGVSYADMSIEERSKMAGKIRDERVKKQIEDGTLKMGMEFEHYIESLEAKEKKHAKDVETLRKEKEEEYNRITSKVERDILKKYEELQGIREEMEFKKIPIPKELDKGIAKAKGYTADRSALSQNYNRIWREYDDLLKSIEVTAKFKERLAKFDAYREAKKEMRIFREEKETAGKIRDLQKKLVTRTMRKVSFNNIDYDNARTIIAIQDILEPNLFAGVNRWLGVEKAWARDIWSGWKTDNDYREQVIRKLDQTETGRKLIELLGNTKTEQQFILWSDADKSRLERMMATKDWKKELKLLDLKKERAGAIQLDVTYKETKRNVYDSEGKWIGEEIFNVAEVSDELAGEIEEKIGTELFENIMHKPWEEWTIGEVEDLAKVIDDLYRDGRDVLKARRLAEKLASADMREKIAAQVATTNIVINDDDSDEIKKKKQKKINKILGVAAGIPGTSEAKARKDNVLNRLLHGYHDANVRRVARILDGWKEGTNTKLLYWKENDCYNRQERAKNARIGRVSMAMKEAGVKMEELFTKVKIDNWLDEDGKPHELTIDELLFFAQAERNNELYKAEQRELGIDERDMQEESSYKAVVYGNLMNENEKEQFRKIDEDLVMQDEQRKALYDAAASVGDIEGMKQYARLDASKYDVYGNLILEGKAAMMATCKTRMEAIMSAYRNLDEKFKAVQDAIAQDYDTSFERMNRASIEEFNTPVWREKWYLPLIRLNPNGEMHESRVKADLLGKSAGTGAAGTEKGFTKKRKEIDEFYQNPVETGLYSTWADSVDRTEHFIAYSGYVRELNRVYMNRDAQGTMQNIKNRYGAQMTSYIQEYIKEVANPKNSTPKSGLDKVVRFLRGNAAPAFLGWKISGVVKQGVTSPMPFMQFVNPLEYAAAAKDFALNASDIREAINEKSVYMKNRKFDPIVDLIAEQKEKNSSSKIKAVRDEFNTKGMQGLEWIDYVCVAPGWLAVYRKENKRLNKMQEELFKQKFEELKSENEALSYDDQRSDAELETQARAETTDLIEELSVKKADDCTRLCQPSNRKVDLSPMFKNGGEIAKAVLQFQTSLNVIWQNIRYDLPYMVKNKMYKNIIGMVAGYTFAGIMLGLVTEWFDDDDDEEKVAKKLLYWSMTQYTDSVPLIGSAITDLANGVITGENGFYGDSSILVSFNKYKDAVMGYFAAGRKSDEADDLEAAGQQKKAEKARKQAEAKYRSAAMNFGNGIALNLGLPASGIKEIGRLFGVGDYDKDGEMDELTFNPGALFGRDPRKKEVEAEKKAEKEKKKKRK